MRKFFLLIACIMMVGCSTIPPVRTTSQTNVFPDIIQWVSFTFEPHAYEEWREEAHKRWTNPIIFACHGGPGYIVEMVDKKPVTKRVWMLMPEGDGRGPVPAESVAWTLHNAYPNQDIIFCVCNRDGEFDLHVPHVWYAKSTVWATPDGRSPLHEQKFGEGGVGSIWEFIEGSDTIPSYKGLGITLPTSNPTTCPTTQPAKKSSSH